MMMQQPAYLSGFAFALGVAIAAGGCTKEMLQGRSNENDPAAAAASWKSANVDPRWTKARDLIMEAQAGMREGRYAQALVSAQEAKTLFEQVNGPNHPDVAKALLTIADLEARQKQFEQAEQDAERAIAIMDKHRGTDAELDKSRALGLAVLAGIYWDANKLGQAEKTYREALTAQEATWGQDHLQLATTQTNLGQLYLTRDRPGEAELLFQKALAIREKALGSDNPQVGMSLSNLALAKRAQGKHAEAEPLEQRAIAILKQTGDPALQKHLVKYTQQLRNLAQPENADRISSQVGGRVQ